MMQNKNQQHIIGECLMGVGLLFFLVFCSVCVSIYFAICFRGVVFVFVVLICLFVFFVFFFLLLFCLFVCIFFWGYFFVCFSLCFFFFYFSYLFVFVMDIDLYRMFRVSLDYPFLIVLSVFSNVFFLK